MYSQGSATDDDISLTASNFEEDGERNSLRCLHKLTCSTIVASATSPEEPVKPNKSADEQGATEGNDLAVDRKVERKRKQESSAGNACKKSKVSQILMNVSFI